MIADLCCVSFIITSAYEVIDIHGETIPAEIINKTPQNE